MLRTFTVARTAGTAASPAISGHTVVWAQAHGPVQPESVYPSLYGADLATGRVFRLPIPGPVVSSALNPPSPAIDGDLVVWMGCQVCDGPGLALFPARTTVYVADLRTSRVAPVAAGAGSQVSPVVSGLVIVWLAEAGAAAPPWAGPRHRAELRPLLPEPVATRRVAQRADRGLGGGERNEPRRLGDRGRGHPGQ